METSGKPVAELERDLGITQGLLNKWKRRYQINPRTEQVEPSPERQLEAVSLWIELAVRFSGEPVRLW